MIITFNAVRNRFEASWPWSEHQAALPIVKAAGFAFDGTVYPKVWHTAGYKGKNKPQEQARLAAKLAAYLDAAAATKMNEWDAEAVAIAERQAQQAEASRATDSNMDIPVPAGLAYLPYQRAGIAYAYGRNRVLIADEMGLGKTIQAIGVSNSKPDIKSVLIVCPASLKLNWQREWMKWDVKHLTVGVVRKAKQPLPATDVVIINYDILTKYTEALRAKTWDLIIADECHKAKNPKAQRTIELLGQRTWVPENREWRIDKEPISARNRVFLTGTPILNRPSELWPFVLSLDPEGLGRYKSKFETRYCGAHATRFGWDKSGATNLGELQTKLRESCMIRRLKSEVLKDLPAKVRQVVVLEANGDSDLVQRECEAYDRVQLEGQEDGPAFQELSRIRKQVAIAKIPYVISHLDDMFEDGGVDKVVVMAHHHEVVDGIAAHFGNACVVVDGRVTSIDARQAAVDRFQTDPTCKVFVGSILAAGVGLTLVAAHHVVFAELDWVPGNVTQAEDRCHRIGQTDTVFVQHIVLDGSVDAKLVDTIISKQAVITSALDAKPVEAPKPAAGTAPLAEPVRRATELREVNLTEEQVAAVHQALRTLAGMCDHAQDRDGAGFNKMDAQFGHKLAQEERLSPKQAMYGQKMVRKYHRQLSAALLEAAGCAPIVEGE